MLSFFALLPLLFAPSAQAGTLTVTKQGLVMPYVWVDGAEYGKLKKKTPIMANLPDGPHEVWVAAEPSGTVTLCHGVVDVTSAGASANIRLMGCDGIRPGWADRTFFKGASVRFTMAQDLDVWVSVDGGQVLNFPVGYPVELNLTPGQHNVVLYTDVMKSAVFDQGTFTLQAGQELPITCTGAGCMGFDQPPIYLIIDNQPPPGISINVPGISVNVGGPLVNVNVNGGAPAGNAQGSAPTSSPRPASSGSSSNYCCVNGAYYDCPSADAVYQCTGRLMECQTGCMMNGSDPDCMFGCVDKYPPDPSSCSRTPAQDNSCK